MLKLVVLVILIGTLGAQLTRRSFWLPYVKFVFPCAVVAVCSVLTYWSYLQYTTWQSSPITKYLLPPYQSFGYFYGYVGVRLWAHWLIALAAALLLSEAAAFMNRKAGGRFFEEEELAFFALGVFLTGYPGFLFYVIAVMAFAVLLSIMYTLFRKGRAPLYYAWLPAALFVILVAQWLIPQEVVSRFGL